MSERGSKKKGKECSSNYIHYNRSEETNKQYTKRGKNGVQTRRVYAFPSHRFTPFSSRKDEGEYLFFLLPWFFHSPFPLFLQTHFPFLFTNLSPLSLRVSIFFFLFFVFRSVPFWLGLLASTREFSYRNVKIEKKKSQIDRWLSETFGERETREITERQIYSMKKKEKKEKERKNGMTLR